MVFDSGHEFELEGLKYRHQRRAGFPASLAAGPKEKRFPMFSDVGGLSQGGPGIEEGESSFASCCREGAHKGKCFSTPDKSCPSFQRSGRAGGFPL